MTTTEKAPTRLRHQFSDREIATNRAPTKIVESPSWFPYLPGPSFDRIAVASDDNNLMTKHELSPIGPRIKVSGSLLDRTGAPVPHTLIELWQVNASGRYRDPTDPGFFPLDPNFTGIGRVLTDADGNFSFRTVRPGPYTGPKSGRYRPAHLHFSVFGKTLGNRLITQCYFPDDPLIAHDPVMIATPDQDGLERLLVRFDYEGTERGSLTSALAYDWDIVLPRAMDHENEELADEKMLVANASQTVGPLYGFALMFENSERAVPCGSPGAVEIRGRLIDGKGDPVPYPEAMIEFFVGDQFARTRTNPDGEFSALVRKPEAVAAPNGEMQAPHLNVTILANQLGRQAQTRLYFPDEIPANDADPLLAVVPPKRRATLIAKPEGTALRFDIHLQGENETVFFSI